MASNYITSTAQLPVPESQRACTDKVCIIFGPLFFISVIILAIWLRKDDYILQLDYSVDSDGRTCGKDLPDHPNLYYPNPRDYNQQLCVAKCPAVDDQSIQCKPTKKYPCPSANTIIDSERIDTERGNYCLPKFESFRYKVIQNAGLVELKNEKAAIKIAKTCIPLAICFGILYLVLIQFFPKIMVWISLIGAGLSLIILGVLVILDWSFIWQKHQTLKIAFGILMIFFGLTIMSMIWVYRGQIALCDIFLRYAGIFLRHYSPWLFLSIPIFTILTLLFMGLCFYMHNSFYNFYPPTIERAGNYYVSSPSYLLVIVNGFAFFWGLNILRDSFTYILSGNAVQWYFTHRSTHVTFPAKRLVLKNLGSVIGGAYLNTLFLIPSMIFDAITCQQKLLSGCHNECCRSFLSFVNIARKDSYAYINLTGIQICNSARQCQQLCARSPLFPGSHSCLLPFRTAIHMSSLIPVVIITIFYLMRVGSGGYFHLYPVLLVVFLSLCLLTYLIDIHADVAEGLQTCYFIEHQLYQINTNTSVWVGPVEMISQIEGAAGRYSQVGNVSVI